MEIRDGKGGKARVQTMPVSLAQRLLEQREGALKQRGRDRVDGLPRVWLPDALAVKYPQAAESPEWFWLLPSDQPSRDSRTGVERRHHLHEQLIAALWRGRRRRPGWESG